MQSSTKSPYTRKVSIKRSVLSEPKKQLLMASPARKQKRKTPSLTFLEKTSPRNLPPS